MRRPSHLSDRLLQQAEDKTGRMGLVIEILILRALAFQGTKETERALADLEQALALAQPEQYVRVCPGRGRSNDEIAVPGPVPQGSEWLCGSAPGQDWHDPHHDTTIQSAPHRAPHRARSGGSQVIDTGCSNQDIADQLFISIPTVKRHISNIYAKLGVESRTQAVAIGKELKIFE